MTSELITMGVSTLAGFAMRYMAESRKEAHARQTDRIERFNAEEDSKKRAEAIFAPFIRRFLVISIVFAVVFATFIIAVWFPETPVVIQYTEVVKGLGARIFGGEGREVNRFVAVHGYVVTEEVRHALFAIIGIYCGQSVGR